MPPAASDAPAAPLQRLLCAEELPPWYPPRLYIHRSYRPPFPNARDPLDTAEATDDASSSSSSSSLSSFSSSWARLWRRSNETGNIFTHLLGLVAWIYVCRQAVHSDDLAVRADGESVLGRSAVPLPWLAKPLFRRVCCVPPIAHPPSLPPLLPPLSLSPRRACGRRSLDVLAARVLLRALLAHALREHRGAPAALRGARALPRLLGLRPRGHPRPMARPRPLRGVRARGRLPLALVGRLGTRLRRRVSALPLLFSFLFFSFFFVRLCSSRVLREQLENRDSPEEDG